MIEQLKAPEETIDAAIAAASTLKAALNSNKNDKATISQVRRKLAKLKPVFSTELGINQVQETSGNRFTNQLFESPTDVEIRITEWNEKNHHDVAEEILRLRGRNV